MYYIYIYTNIHRYIYIRIYTISCMTIFLHHFSIFTFIEKNKQDRVQPVILPPFVLSYCQWLYHRLRKT